MIFGRKECILWSIAIFLWMLSSIFIKEYWIAASQFLMLISMLSGIFESNKSNKEVNKQNGNTN
jgi:hypothetical protein